MVEILKDYATKRLDLLKMDVMERGVVTAGSLTFIILLALFGTFFLILLNIGLAVLVGQWVGNYGYGFLIVAGFYLLLLIGVFIFGKNIKDSIANKLLKSFNDPKHE